MPFTAFSEASQYTPGPLWLRPFGLYEIDLNVDFRRAPRPFLVTDILACCTIDGTGKGIDQGFFWRLSVGTRIDCLLLIVSCGGRQEISAQRRCPGDGCGGELEIELSIDELREIQARACERDLLVAGYNGGELTLRRPSGTDQLNWLKSRFPDAETALAEMAGSLLVAGGNGLGFDLEQRSIHDWLPAIDSEMEDFDPLVNFALLVRCPFCAQENRHELDLEELSLGILRTAQARLLGAVHQLVSHYHWSERQVFEVPVWRWSQYLALIARRQTWQ